MILGPNMFGIVKEETIINIFSEIGAALLFFVLGLRFNFNTLRSLGFKPITIFLIEFFVSFFGLFSVFNILGFEYYQSLFLSLVFSNSTLAILSQLIDKQKRENEFLFKNLIFVSLLEDLSLIILLLVVVTIIEVSNASFDYLIFEVMKRLTLLLLSLYFLQYFLQKIIPRLEKYGEDVLITFSLAIVGIVVSFLTLYGIPISIAAFLVGSSLSVIYFRNETFSTIEKLSNIFISIFFISIGLKMDPNEIFTFQSFLPLLTIVTSIFFFKFFGNVLGSYLVYSDFSLAVKSGIFMSVIGESSIYLTYYGIKLGILDYDFLGTAGMIVLLTTLLAFGLSKKSESIEELLEKTEFKRGIQKMRKIILNIISNLKRKSLREEYINLIFEFAASIILLILISIVINYLPSEETFLSIALLIILFSVFLFLVWRIITNFLNVAKYLNIKYLGKEEWIIALLYLISLLSLCIFSLTFPRNQFGKFIDVAILFLLILGIYEIFKFNNKKGIYKYRRK